MEGYCLCRAVRLRCADAREIGVCHCGYCRRWGGGPLLAVHCGTDVDFEGTAAIAEYASSAWAQRGFCRHCGSHLYYRLLPTGEYFVPAGVFEQDDFEIKSQIYIDKKPGYYDLANQTPVLTEAQVVAQHGPPDAAAST